MAVLTLTRLWINRLDTGEGIAAYSGVDRDYGAEAAGEVRTYAGGRRRSVAQEGKRQSFSFTARDVSLATAQLLEEWIGYPVQVRDTRGQRFVGVFFGVKRAEARDPEHYDVGITLEGVTITEGV